MRIVRFLLSLGFCALVVIYVNRSTDTPSFHDSAFQSRHSDDTSLGPLESVMAATIAFGQSLIGLGPEDTRSTANRMPRIETGGPNVLKAATMTDPMAAAAEMAGVEARILNSPMARTIGNMAAKQAHSQSGARFVKITD